MIASFKTFSILDHLEKLTPANAKGKYICPVCDGNNLSVSRDGKYQCWNGCECKDIREVLAPWAAHTQDEGKRTRPKGEKEFYYPDREGNPLVRVKRIDYGDGKKTFYQSRWDGKQWVNGLTPEVKTAIPIYRYAEVQDAIARGELIFWVEGEGVADELWNLGIAATTSIGGSGGYTKYGNYSQDLKDARLVICPDRDLTGIKYAEEVAKDYPNAQWCYAYPDSPTWYALSKNGGLDIADWIADFKLNAERIMAAVGEKRDLKPVNQISDAPSISTLSLRDRILEILNRTYKTSERKAALLDLAQSTGHSVREIEKLGELLEFEVDFKEDADVAKVDLPQLLEAHKKEIDPKNYLWGDGGKLAEVITRTAIAMPTAIAPIFTTFLSTSASRIGTSSRIVVKASAKYVQPCIFWTAIVARSGALKTPTQRVAVDPLVELEVEAKKDYQQALKAYDEAKEQWQEGDPTPAKPVRKRYLTKDSTLESLERLHNDNSRGLLVYRDELVAEFKAQNAYRGGRGADQEALLDQWNGSPLITDRKEREISIPRSAINRTGSIQWEVLQSYAGDHNDFNGFMARWLYSAVESPPRYFKWNESQDTGIDEILKGLYRSLELLPEQDYFLSPQAGKMFERWQNQLVDMEIQEAHSGMRAVYPKIEAYTARFALWLHIINSTLAGEVPPQTINASVMAKAIELAQFYLGQSRLVYAVNSPQSELTGRLFKLEKFLKNKTGLTAREIKRNFGDYRSAKTPIAEVRQECLSLVEQGYLRYEGDIFY